jgi:hypothetical protein
LHIPKTAGTTVNFLLEKNFMADETCGSLDGLCRLSIEEKQNLAFTI